MKQVYVQNFTDADDIMTFKPMLAGTMKDTSVHMEQRHCYA